jgi:hypothetical protein
MKLDKTELAGCCNVVVSELVEAAERQIEVFAMEHGIIVTRDTQALMRSLLVMGFERGVAYGEAHCELGYSPAEAVIAGAKIRTTDIIQSEQDVRNSVTCIIELLKDMEGRKDEENATESD